MGGGRFYFDDFSKKRIALFFTNGEFLIGIILFLFSFFFLRYFLPFILDLLIYPFFYRLAKPLIKTMCKISRVIRLKKKNMLSELKPRNNKDKIIYPNMKKLLRFFYFKRIEINTPIYEIKKLCMEINLLLIYYIPLYCYFLKNKFIFTGIVDSLFFFVPISILIYSMYNKSFIEYLLKYPNILSTIFIYKTIKNEPT